MQIADRARFSPAAWPQADMHPTSCSCLICVESSVKSCGSERDPVIHSVFLFLFFSFIFISWRRITLQYCSGFCHTLTWISHGFTCIPHPDPPSLPFSSIAGKTLWHAGLFLSSNLSCHSVRVRGGKAKRVCLSRAIDTLVVLPLLFQNPILDTYRGLPPSSGQCPSASLPWNLGKCDNPYGRIHKRGSFYP